MTDSTTTLIEILARVDALFAPCRSKRTSATAAAAIHERRRLYRSAGVLIVGGGNSTTRKNHSRHLDELRAAGWIVTTGRARLHVQLTDAADEYLRRTTLGYTTAEAMPLLALIDVLTELGATNCGFVNESDVVAEDRPATSLELGRLELWATPLLARGWLESAGDTCNRIGYRITDGGRQMLTTDQRETAVDLPEYNPEHADLYDDLYAAELAARASWIPTRPSHVIVPLSAGMWRGVPAA